MVNILYYIYFWVYNSSNTPANGFAIDRYFHLYKLQLNIDEKNLEIDKIQKYSDVN